MGLILDANQNGGAVRQSVILPARSLVIVEPLHRDIFRALGHSTNPPPTRPRTTLTFAGFPTANCAATSACKSTPKCDPARVRNKPLSCRQYLPRDGVPIGADWDP